MSAFAALLQKLQGNQSHALGPAMAADRSSPLQMGLGQLEASVAERTLAAPRRKNKVTLMVLNMFPLAWCNGLDRLYLGSYRSGLAKLILSVLTCGIGGIIWGVIDFCAVLINAFLKRSEMKTLGIEVTFHRDELETAYFLAFVDVLMVPVWYGAWRLWLWVRWLQRVERLKRAYQESPSYKAKQASSASGQA